MPLMPLCTNVSQVLFKSSAEAGQKQKQSNKSSLSKPRSAGNTCYFSRLNLAPQVIQTRFQGSRLGLLPWSYTFKEIRAGRQQREAAAGKTQGACSANKAKVTVLKLKGGGGEGSFPSVSSQSKAGNKGSSGGGE